VAQPLRLCPQATRLGRAQPAASTCCSAGPQKGRPISHAQGPPCAAGVSIFLVPRSRWLSATRAVAPASTAECLCASSPSGMRHTFLACRCRLSTSLAARMSIWILQVPGMHKAMCSSQGIAVLCCRLRRSAIPPGFEAEFTACVLCSQRFRDLCEACGTARPPARRLRGVPGIRGGSRGRAGHALGQRAGGLGALGAG
jgi:hypothetical protein